MSKSKDKGRYYEHRTAELMQLIGFHDVARVPGSGAFEALDESLAHDVKGSIGEVEFRAESKMRSHGFARIRLWMKRTGFLVIHEQRKDPIIVLSPSMLAELMQANQQLVLDGMERVAGKLRGAPEGGGEIA